MIWLQQNNVLLETDSKGHLKIKSTNCEIRALATSKDALRGFTPTFLIMDEAAFIDNGSEVFGAALASLGTGGKISLISTPNGMDPLYYKIYDEARVLAENISNIPLTGAVDIGLAHVHFLKGELKAGNILSAQTNDRLQGISQYYLAKGHFVRGQIMIKLGHHKMARESLNMAYSLANQYHDYNKSFITLLAIAESYATTNEKEKAQEIYDQAYNQVVNIGNKRQFAQALVQIATSDYRQGKFESALKRADQIETLSEEIQYQKGKTDALRLRSQINITRNTDMNKNIFTLLACQILYLEVGDEDSS